jgi:DNA-binding CsgD family transcriptional regulator
MALTEFPLVGRESALSEVRLALRATAAGAGGCVVLEGLAGIGKSRVVATLTEEARELDIVVASATATELDRIAPLSTLLRTLGDSGVPELDTSSLGDHASGGDRGNRFWLIDRMGEILERFVRDRPLLIAIDDAQWADELSALALRVLVPALMSSPVLWLLARRPVPARSSTQDAVNWLISEGAGRVVLAPLSHDAVHELCRIVLGADPDEAILDLTDRCGGNPFLLEWMLNTVRDDGRVAVPDRAAVLVADGLPSQVFTVMNQQLLDLSSGARRLLDAGSVLGRPFTVHEASALVNESPVELLPAVDEAVGAGTLIERESALTFRHDLIREAIYQNLSGPVRTALHREAATMAQAEGCSPVEIAEHLVLSGARGDERAVGVLHQAATQVAPSAPGTAADLMLRSLDLLDHNDPARAGMVATSVRLLAAAGRVMEARELGEVVLRASLDPSTESTLLLGLATALKHAGLNATVVSYTQRALAIPGIPEPTRAELLAIEAHALVYVEDLEGADRAAAEAAAVGESSGVPAAVVFGLVARSVVSRAKGELSQAITWAEQAVETADRALGEARHRHPGLWLAWTLVAVDRFDEADAAYHSGQQEARQLGTAWSFPLWHFYRAELRLAAGRLDDAQAEAEAGVRIAEQLAAMQLGVPLLALLARVALSRDEPAVARNHVRKAQGLVGADVAGIGAGNLAWSVALLENAGGSPEAAVETLADLYDGFPSRLRLLVDEPGAGPMLVRMAKRAGARGPAARAAQAIRSLADRNPGVATLAGCATHAEGLLDDDLDALRAAVDLHRGSRRPLCVAAALEDTAVAEHRAGNAARAVELLQEALARQVAAGAKRDAARIQKRLRLLGVRQVWRSDLCGPTTTWDSITESELRVVRLVADGLTNREAAERLYLSPHTVDSHLRHVFTKLGIKSRVELTRHVMAHDASGDALV